MTRRHSTKIETFMAMCIAALVMVALTARVRAEQTPTAPAPEGAPQVKAEGDGGKKDEAKKDDAKDGKKDKDKEDDFPKFEEVTKDHKEVVGPMGETGFFPLYYNKKTDQLLAVIPKSMLEKNFLMASSIAGGPTFAGWMWGDHVVQWHEMDKKLVLIEPDLRYKDGGDNPVSDAIKRTYTDRILTSTAIVTKKGQDPVIDLGDIFKKDFADIGGIFGGNMDSSLSRWAKYKAFPKNVEIAVDAAVMKGPGGNEGGTRAQVHYSIVELPKNDYKPREADPRIGYFLTAVKDWTTDHNADTIFKRYVHRWDVRKAEPDKAVSDVDPEHQIVFYIEKTVPVKYRRYVREGILMWNTAFEKAGFRNAVRVEQQTDTVHAEKDPEDVRYAFYRWIVSGRAFAMGPSLANPLTGQILDADIIMDDAMARSWELQYARYSGVGLAAMDDPQLREFLDKHPEWDYKPMIEKLLPENARFSGIDIEMSPEVAKRMAHKHGYCTYATGLAHEMAFNMAWLNAEGLTNRSDEYVGQLIKEVAAHEVGHTLGLRHNFKASSWKSVDEMIATKDHNTPNCGSVMDYSPGMFHPEKEKQGIFVMQAVGPYDDWAIAYGYQQHQGTEHKDEASLLKAITSRVAEPGLAYGTDEDTSMLAPDPLINRYDNSSDNIQFAKHRMEMVRKLQKDISNWAVKDGESYVALRKSFDMLLFEYARAAGFAARYVGGQYMNRDHKGDPNARPPLEIVPAAKQREALDFLVETVFSDKDFKFDPELINKLAAGRWSHWESDAMDTQLDYPIHDRIAATQWTALFAVFNPFNLDRIYDAELKVAADQDTVTVPEVVGKVTSAIWSEVDQGPGGKSYSDKQPYISSVRRSLQRQHLNTLTNIALSQPGSMMAADINAVVTMKMSKLSESIGKILASDGSKLDEFTRAHLDECKSRIDRVLTAKYEL